MDTNSSLKHWNYLGYTWGILGVYLGYTWGIHGAHLGHTWGILGAFLGYRSFLNSWSWIELVFNLVCSRIDFFFVYKPIFNFEKNWKILLNIFTNFLVNFLLSYVLKILDHSVKILSKNNWEKYTNYYLTTFFS